MLFTKIEILPWTTSCCLCHLISLLESCPLFSALVIHSSNFLVPYGLDDGALSRALCVVKPRPQLNFPTLKLCSQNNAAEILQFLTHVLTLAGLVLFEIMMTKKQFNPFWFLPLHCLNLCGKKFNWLLKQYYKEFKCFLLYNSFPPLFVKMVKSKLVQNVYGMFK